MKIKLLLVLFFASLSSFAQYTFIPDVNFEKQLISLGYDSGTADGKVLTANISSITSLNVSNRSIIDLTGIQDFVALTGLNCWSNKLIALDVSKNTALTYLDCSNNNLTSLDLSNNIHLNRLECVANQLTALDVSKNTALNFLDCHSNKLTSLNLKNGNNVNLGSPWTSYINFKVNPDLSCIQVDDAAYSNANWATKKDATTSYSTDCSSVQYTLIPDLNFEKALINSGIDSGTPNGKVLTANISSRTYLDVSNSSITDLTGIQDFVALQSFDCRGNQLTALDLSKNVVLTNLECSGNQLTALDLSKNVVLTNLECSRNQLTALDLSKNVVLKNIHCVENQLKSLNFSNNIALTELICHRNILTALDVSKNTALTELSCNENILTALDVSNNTALTYLDCHLNKLTSLDVSMNTALTKLDCDDNQLKSLNFFNNTALTELSCNGNILTALDVSKNIALTYLGCSENQLTALDVSKNIVLTNLACSYNELTVLDVSKNTALAHLSIVLNLLTNLDVSKNTRLESLWCDENKLKILDVSKNIALTALECTYNQLTNLNLKNGNNGKLNKNSDFTHNPNLICIQVDDIAYAKANWASKKDVIADYSTDCSSVGQFTLIPDVNFEKKLISLGIDSGTPDGKVPTYKISGVTSMDISNSSITNLTGIQDFVTLQLLNCKGNQLTAIDVSKNIALKYLHCYENQLITLDVSKNAILEQLTCYSNKLTTLDVSNNAALTNLYCYSNQLTALDVSKDIALKTLHCYSNQLTSLNVSQNVALTELRCYSNKLTSFDVSKSIALTKLYCYSNQLSALDVSKNIALIELYCYSNQLMSLDVSKNTALKYIDCSSNQLTSLNVQNGRYLSSYNFKNNPNLDCIQVNSVYYYGNAYKDAVATYSRDCSRILIPDVNFEKKLIALGIDSGAVDGQVPAYKIDRLVSLDVSNSSITDLTGIQAFVGLNTLNCSGNQLTALDVSKNTLLSSLNCSSNQLTSLNLKNGNNTWFKSTNNFKNNPDLSCIQVDNTSYSATNWVTAKDTMARYSSDCSAVVEYILIPDANFEKRLITLGYDYGTPDGKVLKSEISGLTTLNVSNSYITDLTGIQDFVALQTLSCAYNELTTLDVSKNTSLTNLTCNNNQLTILDLSNNVALKELSCFYNKLKTLDFSKNITLTKLYCYENQLTGLDVSKNTALTTLVCDNNQLTVLDISKNTALTLLFCNNNQLTSLNLKNGKNTSLFPYNFKNNPNLSCIQVDNASYSANAWATAKDATASYSNNCPAVIAVSSEFENKLIALGIDTDGKNGRVLLASITDVTTLDVSNSGITSLSGIEYFSKLETLKCQGNLLASINVSSNLALKYLDCSKNPLSALDVSKNTQLTELYCDGIATITNKINAKTSAVSQLTVLDVSKNVLLTKLSCSNNQIVSLDLSKNTLLTVINCSNNKLASLNLSNGNKNKLANVNFKTNAPLSCILVDDVAYANANWSTAKDATAIYSKTACILGIGDVVFDKIAVYPNPTKEELYIDNIVLEKASVYDAVGKLVIAKKFTNSSDTNSINLSGFPRGIYYVYLESEGSTVVRKILVE